MRGCGWVWVGGWFVCVVCVCVWFEVCGLWLVCGCVVWVWWVVVVLVVGVCVCCVFVDFELYLRMIDLCGKHSQVGILGWRCTIVK